MALSPRSSAFNVANAKPIDDAVHIKQQHFSVEPHLFRPIPSIPKRLFPRSSSRLRHKHSHSNALAFIARD